MGRPGAVTADILLQTFGIGAFVFGFGFLIWGWRIWKQDSFRPVGARLLCLIARLCCWVLPAAFCLQAGRSVMPRLGGAGGIMLLNIMTGWIDGVVPVLPHVIIALISGIFGFFLFSFGIALRRTERQAVIEGVLNGSVATWDGASGLIENASAAGGSSRTMNSKGDDEDDESDDDEDEDDDEERR